MKTRKPIIVSIILAVVAAVMLFAVSCGGSDDNAYTPPKTYTISFVTDGGTEIEPISAIGGSMIFVPENPTKAGSTFAGWYADDKFTGEAVEIPNIMPDNNVTYYAKFEPIKTEYSVIYEYNIGKAPHTGDIDNVTVEAGSAVTVADGNDYGAVGYMFMGWSIYQSGLVTDVKQEGQYNPGDTITLTDSNITLYAQWAVEYTDMREANSDKIYVYTPMIGKGKEAAKLVREDNGDKKGFVKEGFVKSGDDSESGYDEFSFYGDEFDGGEFTGRLYATRKYAVADGVQGQYVQYDYTFDTIRNFYIMALDGFGFATYITVSGDMLHVSASGDYEYDEEHNEYVFTFTEDTDENGAKPKVAYFRINKQEVKDSEFNGVFSMLGVENGMYVNNDGYPFIMELNGYGGALLHIYDQNGQEELDTVAGLYKGTDYYESTAGEWQFVPQDNNNAEYKLKFILDAIQVSQTEYLPVFYICDETVAGTYTSENSGDKSTLYIDGYGMAEYMSNGILYLGVCSVETKNNVDIVTFEELEEKNGQLVKSGKVMMFTISGGKFAISQGGFIVANGVLTTYNGKSTIVEISDDVTEIAENALNYVNTNVSLVSVTVPASVTKIGKHAFQNNYTLRRVIFLGETPAELDLTDDDPTDDGDPFRWGAGDFKIVVPQAKVAVYKAAWEKYADYIIGSDDASKLPEFVVDENGVLVQYNKPDDLVDGKVVIPDDVTEIADNVFRGLTGIKSVDLNNVKKLGDSAFYGCTDLVEVKFTNVESVGALAFAACDKLNNSGTKDELILPAIKTIGESAFSGCESLRLVKLGTGLEEIDDFAFYLCNVYEADPPLFVELLGETAPVMGNKIALGNIAFRFKVQSIEVAIKCYREATWNAYCSHLYIESGAEKGMYISGDYTLVLDGRALYQSSYVWMYKINGNKITFYEYDSYESTYTTITGTYENDTITFVLGGRTRHFVRLKEEMTYKTKDGKYTLVCDPLDLQPDSYEGSSGTAKVKFNGKEVDLFVSGYNTKIIYNFKDEDGKLYDIYVSFDGEALDITKKLSPIRYALTAEDGSKITILFKNDLIYIETAEFVKIEVDTNRTLYWTEASGLGVFAEQNGNVYTFSFRFRSDTYRFTVIVSEDNKTFAYTYTKA
ncbi:MAG: leucine-rich repeat protein [Clostridiales bacterium]|nr:leucine-rich repeat protein [Clostridiales bacterium]